LELCECVVSKEMKVKETKCRTALCPSKIPGMDYCLNPYVGCEHSCIYCYAVFMRRYTEHREEWGNFVDVKANFVEKLASQLQKARPGAIMLGTVTDAYQPIEKGLGITRRCLELLTKYDFEVHIQTKSDLILRDLDLLKQIRNLSVGFTITTLDERIADQFEPKASKVSQRLEGLKILSKNGIRTFAFVGPILPSFSDNIGSLKRVFQKISDLKINKVYVDRMHYWGDRWERIKSFIGNYYPYLSDYYIWSKNNYREYSAKIRNVVQKSLTGTGLDCEVLF
jgi:DNA repair photolyase